MKAIRFLIILLFCNLMIVYKPFCKEVDIYEKLESSMIRFHVIANSDSDFDQKVKYEIKDEVMSYLNINNDFSNDKNDNISILKRSIKKVEKISENILKNNNLNYDVDVKFEKKYFEDRIYDGFLIPEGIYDSFVIYLGEAKGKNFWSMIFPSIGFIDYDDEFKENNSTMSIFLDEKSSLETFKSNNKKKNNIKFSFKIVDIFKSFIDKIF